MSRLAFKAVGQPEFKIVQPHLGRTVLWPRVSEETDDGVSCKLDDVPAVRPHRADDQVKVRVDALGQQFDPPGALLGQPLRQRREARYVSHQHGAGQHVVFGSRLRLSHHQSVAPPRRVRLRLRLNLCPRTHTLIIIFSFVRLSLKLHK